MATQRFPPEQIGNRETLLEGAADVSRHNLPAPRTSFVGRQRVMVDAKRELAMTRLLTLTGVGGTGKTRLALEVARDLVDAYPDGVWQVELAPLSGSEQVPQAVARGLQPLSSLSSRSPSGLRLLTLFNRNFGGY
jgi:Cdc6-like AAA superfamily ATPase